MKEIYWIDDDFQMMFQVIQGVIKELWRLDQQSKDAQKVRSNILVFGNAWMDSIHGEHLPSQQDEDKAYIDLMEWYNACCFKLDGPDITKKTYCDNLHLVEDSVNFLLKNDCKENVSMFCNILKKWTEGEDNLEISEDYYEAQQQVSDLINLMNIKEGAVVGLDLSLLGGDYERTKAGKRVISMELFNQLKHRNKCFLYSTDAGQFDFIQKWKVTFRKYYPDQKEGNNRFPDINIYERKFLFEKDNEETIKDIQQLLND